MLGAKADSHFMNYKLCIKKCHYFRHHLVVRETLYINRFITAHGHTGTATLAKSGIDTGSHLNQIPGTILYFFFFDSVIRTYFHTKQTTRTTGKVRWSLAVYHSYNRLTCQFIARK